jgi:hypothetical protein
MKVDEKDLSEKEKSYLENCNTSYLEPVCK